MGNDLHARAHTLARVRRGRMDVSDRWDSSGRTARDNYLTCSPAAAALLIPRQFRFTLRTRDERQRDELAPPHSITSSAATCSVSGTLMPSAFAGFRSMTNSNLVGCRTGNSAGLSPLGSRTRLQNVRTAEFTN